MDDWTKRFDMVERKTTGLVHLFRPWNLLIVVLTMYFLRYGLLLPMLELTDSMVEELNFVSQIPDLWFALLVLSVVLIAAGGYIINDYKDVKVDQLNHRPNPIGKSIPKETAYLWYQITSGLGLALGFLVAYKLGNYNFGIIQLAAAISLWFYSYYFKTEFLVGNLVVAFVVALVPLTVGIYEVTLLQIAYNAQVKSLVDFNFNFIAYWFMAYALFAFLLTLAREILKDVEDREGDRQIGARTLPVVWGKKAAFGAVTFINSIIVLGVIFVGLYFLTDIYSTLFIYMLITLVAWNTIILWWNKNWKISASSWNKIISLVGIFYLLVLRFIIQNQLFF